MPASEPDSDPPRPPPPQSQFHKGLMPRPGPSFVTLPRRKPATLAADERGRWPDRWWAASSQDHGDDVDRRTGPAAPVDGRAGVGAVGPGHAPPGRGAPDGSADAPGPPR